MTGRPLGFLWPRPRPAVAWTAAALASAAWGVLRLVVFQAIVLPLTYVLPLLLCVWTRNLRMLWTMAAVFAVLHTLKQFWILPGPALPTWADWATYGATLLNIAVGGAAIHGIVVLLDRVDAQSQSLARHNDELAAQAEEMAQQNEELAQQGEELSQQSEELSRQNEHLVQRGEEVRSLNWELGQREALLGQLLDAVRESGTERSALDRVCAAAAGMLGEPGGAAVIYERAGDRLLVRGAAGEAGVIERLTASDVAFARLVIEQDRVAGLDDAALRPDLGFGDGSGFGFGAALGAPLVGHGGHPGALMVFRPATQAWTEQQFRVAQWLAAQASQILQVKRAEQALRDADQRKSDFLATLSHELRNPLAPLRVAVKLLEDDHDGNRAARAKQVIERQVALLVRLVDDLLDVTRITNNRIELRTARVDISTVMEAAVEGCLPDIEQAAHDFQLTMPSEPVWVEGDPARLTQVLTNLLNNAAKFTPHGGRVALSCHADERELCLSIRDNGPGLRAEDIDRVFEWFERAGEPGRGGLGIGLWLVRELVRLHGGTVDASSDGPGSGCEFRVRLPRAAAPVPASAGQPTPRVEASAQRRILVVDDNLDAAEMMRVLLEIDGHAVQAAYHADSALARLATQRFDVGLFDIGLPGMSGYELASRVRQMPSQEGIYLVAITGWGQDSDRERARQSGFDAHLTKPVDPDVLRSLFARDAPGCVSLNAQD